MLLWALSSQLSDGHSFQLFTTITANYNSMARHASLLAGHLSPSPRPVHIGIPVREFDLQGKRAFFPFLQGIQPATYSFEKPSHRTRRDGARLSFPSFQLFVSLSWNSFSPTICVTEGLSGIHPGDDASAAAAPAGRAGIALFFSMHVCSNLCARVGLTPFALCQREQTRLSKLVTTDAGELGVSPNRSKSPMRRGAMPSTHIHYEVPIPLGGRVRKGVLVFALAPWRYLRVGLNLVARDSVKLPGIVGRVPRRIRAPHRALCICVLVCMCMSCMGAFLH